MGIFDSVKKLLVVPDEDELMDDEIYEEPSSRSEKKTLQSQERIENLRPERKVYRKNRETEEVPEPVRERRIEKNNKIVPIRRTSNGGEVCVIKIAPASKHEDIYDQAQDVSDLILEGKAVVVNLEGVDVDAAQRVMDFISGSLYAVQGNIRRVSMYIFIVSPDGVDISGDFVYNEDRLNANEIFKEF